MVPYRKRVKALSDARSKHIVRLHVSIYRAYVSDLELFAEGKREDSPSTENKVEYKKFVKPTELTITI